MENKHENKDLIRIGDIAVEITRKNIKHLRLTISLSTGRILLSAPMRATTESMRLFVDSKLAWIAKHRQSFVTRQISAESEYISGEYHYFLGRRYTLQLSESADKPAVILREEKNILELCIYHKATKEQKEAVLNTWYRQEFYRLLPALSVKWENAIGVKAKEWWIKRMKTKWGTCNIRAKRIWLNLELIKKPIETIEYVIVHELVHFFEKYHNERFYSYMSQYFPDWKRIKSELNGKSLDS